MDSFSKPSEQSGPYAIEKLIRELIEKALCTETIARVMVEAAGQQFYDGRMEEGESGCDDEDDEDDEELSECQKVVEAMNILDDAAIAYKKACEDIKLSAYDHCRVWIFEMHPGDDEMVNECRILLIERVLDFSKALNGWRMERANFSMSRSTREFRRLGGFLNLFLSAGKGLSDRCKKVGISP